MLLLGEYKGVLLSFFSFIFSFEFIVLFILFICPFDANLVFWRFDELLNTPVVIFLNI